MTLTLAVSLEVCAFNFRENGRPSAFETVGSPYYYDPCQRSR